jgi:acyl-coenzyme A thioesterase PaaI-like protein
MTVDPELRMRAAAALRDLNHAFVAHDADDATLERLARTLRAEAETMREGPRRDRLALIRAAREAAGTDAPRLAAALPGSGFEDRAVAGQANPTAVDLEVDFSGDDVVATVLLRPAFAGAPGRAHGGIVAAVFDDVTGFVIGRLGEPAFTGELTVRFEAAVPVGVPLEVRTRLDGRERRKLFISGEMRADGAVVARCRAIYVTVDPSLFAGAGDPR